MNQSSTVPSSGEHVLLPLSLGQLSAALTEAKSRQLAECNSDETAFPADRTVVDLFEEQAAATPDRVAVVFQDETLTYGALNLRANRLAHALIARGVGPDVPVALCLARSIAAVVGILSILKAGGAYVPLDPSYPPARLRQMLADCGAGLMLAPTTAGAAPFAAAGAGSAGVSLDELAAVATVEVLGLDPFGRITADVPDAAEIGAAAEVQADTASANPQRRAAPADLAYIIYTSGSTGTPKGVMIEHRSLLASTLQRHDYYGRRAPKHLLLMVSVAFDVATGVIHWALTGGHRLVLAGTDAAGDPTALMDTLRSGAVTDLICPTPVYGALLAARFAGAAARVADGDLPALRNVIIGGETGSPALLAAHFRQHPEVALRNEYGPTEASVWSTVHRFIDAEEAVDCIGKPLPGTGAHILDADLAPVPIGAPGELCIAGRGLARGYLNRPELTAERFPERDTGGWTERLYRTGDRACWRPDGRLQYLGRLDHQVKLRGFRIELGEIEAVLARHPGVREAVVVLRDGGVNPALAAYLTPERTAGTAPDDLLAELRPWLKARLPNHMVPSTLTVLDAFALTPNGKIDRNALPTPSAPVPGSERILPRTARERQLATCWEAVLKRPDIGVHDNFFDLGGDSILSIQIIARARALGLGLTPKDLFSHQTIAELACVVRSLNRVDVEERQVRDESEPTTAADDPGRPDASAAAADTVAAALADAELHPISRDQPLPLSHFQEWFWHEVRRRSERNLLRTAIGLHLQGALDTARLRDALTALAQRHELLRTVFPERDGTPVQQPLHAPELPLEVRDHSPLPALAQQQALIDFGRAFVAAPFDLAQRPPWRCALISEAEDQHVLLLCLHHILFDGMPDKWLLALADLYRALASDRPLPPPAPIQYADFAHWERQVLTPAVAEHSLDYWRGWFARGLPPALGLPFQRSMIAPVGYAAIVPFALDAELVAAIDRFTRQARTTRFITLLTALAVLLHRAGGGEDIVFNSFIADQRHPALAGMLGPTSRRLYLRLDLSDRPSFTTLLGRARQALLDAVALQYLPITEALERLGIPRDDDTPLSQAMITYLPAALSAISEIVLPGLRTSILPGNLFAGTDKVMLPQHALHLYEIATDGATAEGGAVAIEGAWRYQRELFDGSDIERLASALPAFLKRLTEQPRIPLTAIDLTDIQPRNNA